MKTYDVTLTVVYNGHMEIEAANPQRALDRAQEELNAYNLDGFPDEVTMANGGHLTFGEATADYAEEIVEFDPVMENDLINRLCNDGGFVRLKEPLEVTVTEDDVEQVISLRGIVMADEGCGSNPKGITEDFVMWDLFDYLNDRDLVKVYDAVVAAT